MQTGRQAFLPIIPIILCRMDGKGIPVEPFFAENQYCGIGIGIALEEFCELADIGLLRPFATTIKLKISLEVNEDRRQRCFVDRHHETP